jgi:hypothetical protein
MDEQRRYSRIQSSEPASIELAGSGDRISTTLRNISCDGVGIDLEPGTNLQPPTRVRVHLSLHGAAVDLPARVVWSSPSRAGLHLLLAETDRDSKKAFGAWITPLTKELLSR